MSKPNRVSHKLKAVVRRELGLELDKDHQDADWGGRLTDEMLAYAGNARRCCCLSPRPSLLGPKK